MNQDVIDTATPDRTGSEGQFGGIVPPVVTPRAGDGTIDVESLRRVVDHLVDGGVDGLFVLGSSGETPYLTTAERDLVNATVVEAAAGRVPVLAGANEQTTARVVEEGSRLASAGVDALVVTTPYYALSNAAEIAAHFRTVREQVDLPLFAYDVPVRTHVKLPLDLLVDLAEDGTLAGVKDSSGDDVAFRLLLLATSHLPEFRVFTGHEVVVDGALLGGAHGAVPGLANVDPAGYARMFAAAHRGDWTSVRAEQDRLARLFSIVTKPDSARVSPGAAGLGAFKTALQLLGVIENNTMSSPMVSLDAAEASAVREVLVEAGLL